MAGVVLLAVWLGAAGATAGGAWLIAARRRRGGEASGENEDDETTASAGAGARTDRIDRRTALAAVAAAAIGFEAGGRYVGDPTAGAALAAGLGTGGLLAVAVPSGPDRQAIRSQVADLRSVRLSDLPRPSLPSPPDVPALGDDGAEAADAPLPATPEQVTDDADEAAAATTETTESADDASTGLRPDTGDDPAASVDVPTTVSLSDGAPSERPDGPVVFADGAGSGEECRNCGATDAGVRQTRIATVPDRESDTVALCDGCRVATAAREDDPEDCAAVARRVRHVGGDDGRCDNCGYIGRLAAHAVVPLSDAGQPHRANAVALCETCHDAAHGVAERPEDEPTP
jgi:hypothetical protein